VAKLYGRELPTRNRTQRRLRKLQEIDRELQELPPSQRGKRLAYLQGRITDLEQDEDDLDDDARDHLLDETTIAQGLDQLGAELAALGELEVRAGKVREHGQDSKLSALRECLSKAEFHELHDGRGKLLIFTEHRDTLRHLRQHLESWHYSVCEIHGGMNPHERKRAQEEFRTRISRDSYPQSRTPRTPLSPLRPTNRPSQVVP
jgi:SNF2 family DNA or RNA helicase